MKKINCLAGVVFILIINVAQGQNIKNLISGAEQEATVLKSGNANGNKPLSDDEIISGLKEALNVGAKNSTTKASAVDGFYKNPEVFIPFPPDAQKVKDRMDKLGMQQQTDKFVETMNRAAEEASKDAAAVFLDAIKAMTVKDGITILKGPDNAATQYLHDMTSAQLTVKFTPIVQAAINKVELTKYWDPIITEYNKIPFVEKQNPDLTAYVTDRALVGLFKLIADEELKIRKDPVARVSDILKRVFGSIAP